MHAQADLTPATVTVAVVADDLIWASRLLEAVQRTGATAVRLGSTDELAITLGAATLDEPPSDRPGGRRLLGAIVDLFGHRYDGVEAVRRIAAAQLPVIAVAQHDDLQLRKLALDAGASRVFSYSKFFTDGPLLIARWLDLAPTHGPT